MCSRSDTGALDHPGAPLVGGALFVEGQVWAYDASTYPPRGMRGAVSQGCQQGSQAGELWPLGGVRGQLWPHGPSVSGCV